MQVEVWDMQFYVMQILFKDHFEKKEIDTALRKFYKCIRFVISVFAIECLIIVGFTWITCASLGTFNVYGQTSDQTALLWAAFKTLVGKDVGSCVYVFLFCSVDFCDGSKIWTDRSWQSV